MLTDMVVLVSHTSSGLQRTVLGGVADRLLHGPIPVLVLKPDTDTSGLIQDFRSLWTSSPCLEAWP
jgi:hypothetical protein